MLSTLVLATTAATLLSANNNSEACMNFYLTKRHYALIGTLAIIASPILIPVGIGYGALSIVGAGFDAAKNALEKNEEGRYIYAAKSDDASKQRQAASQIKEFFEKAEKEPTPANLAMCGLKAMLAEDFRLARQYLRRAVELAKKDPNWEKNPSNLSSVCLALFTLGQLKMKANLFDQAYEHYQEAHALVVKHFGAVDDSKVDAEHKILDAAQIQREISYANLNRALYDLDDFLKADGSDDEVIRAKNLNESAAELIAQAVPFAASEDSTDPDKNDVKYTVLLRAAIATFYQKANEHCYFWGIPHAQPDDADYHTQLLADQGPRGKAFQDIVVPAFKNVLAAASKAKLDKDDAKRITGYCHYYLARSYFVFHDKDQAIFHFVQAKNKLLPSEIAAFDQESAERRCESILSSIERNDVDPTELLSLANLALMAHGLILENEDNSGKEGHRWTPKTFHRPSWCGVCQKFISLSERNGFICENPGCELRVHAECKAQVGDDAPCLKANLHTLANHQHIFRKKVLHRFTNCGFCFNTIKDPWNSLRCFCGLTIHKDPCSKEIANAIIADEEKK